MNGKAVIYQPGQQIWWLGNWSIINMWLLIIVIRLINNFEANPNNIFDIKQLGQEKETKVFKCCTGKWRSSFWLYGVYMGTHADSSDWQRTHADSSDRLRGSHITQYCCDYCQVAVPLRVLWGYSAATACVVASQPFVTVALEYPHSTLNDTATWVATAVLRNMRPT